MPMEMFLKAFGRKPRPAEVAKGIFELAQDRSESQLDAVILVLLECENACNVVPLRGVFRVED